MMKRRLFSVFLAVLLCFTLLPTVAFADVAVTDEGTCGATESDNVTWKLTSDGTLTISGSGTMADYDVGALNGTITSDNRPWKDLVNDIKSVVIENGVKNIGKYAFSACTNLTSITIPNSVQSIMDGALSSCTSLTSVTIPNSVQNIGDYAFMISINLRSVYCFGENPSIGDDAFLFCASGCKFYAYTTNTNLKNCIETLNTQWGTSYTFVPLDGTCGDGVSWKLSADGTLTISGSGTLTAVSDWATLAQNGMIKKVLIDGGVTYSSLGFTPKYTVTFQNGDTVCATYLFLSDGQTASKPADPQNADFNFAGWYEKENGALKENAFDFATKISANLTLHAKWNCAKHEDVSPKDHACDTCGATMGEHVAAAGTHTCDYCGKSASDCVDENPKDHKCDVCGTTMGEHVDANKDHICDYGCSESIGTCEDKDLDHKCDYGCDKPFGTHEDADHDHICDYGCSVTIGTCEDKDHDHKCDYGCNKPFGTHADTNNDHICDYGCSESIGTCEDKDLDHKCDYGCDKTFGTHADTNNDHICDYGCSEKIGTCEDKDYDHKCDYGCNKTFGEHVAADRTHTCAYCSKPVSTCVDENPIDHLCDICGAKLSEHVYSWVTENGKYWQTCSVCHGETEKKDIPACTINGAEKLCNGEDYTLALTLPEGANGTVAYFVCGQTRKPINLTVDKNGVTTGTIDAAMYEDLMQGESLALTITAYTQTADGYFLEATKTLTILPTHSGGTATCKDKAVCTICGKSYGELDADNHTGTTERRNAKDATCTADGYTGDVHCTDCGEKIADGSAIAKLGHKDENKDHICDRETCKAIISAHSGGTATCKDKAVCTYCGKSYGELDADNHTGKTELRNAKDATCTADGYSGDTYCADCGEKLTDGTIIAKTGHSYESKVTKEPTQTDTGIKTYTCKHCGHTYDEVLDSLANSETLPQTWDASPFVATLTIVPLTALALIAFLLLKKRRNS